MTLPRLWSCLMGILVASVIPGCVAPEGHEFGEASAMPSGEADTVSRPSPALVPVPSAPVRFGVDSGQPGFSVALRTADQVSGAARRFGTVSRGIALRIRTPDLVQYPCTSCHLGLRVVMAERVPDAHQNIRPVHPRATGGVCRTCHAAENVERLRVRDGEDPPSLDHAYRLCAECHFQQVADWAGGAHGKRLDGWQGPRTVMGCANCHDPHAPALDPRIPYRAPVLPVTGGGH